MNKNIKIINRKSTVNFSNEGLETKIEEKVTNLSPKELKMQIELMNLDELKVKVGDKILPLKAKDLKDDIELIIDKEDNLQYMMDKQKIFQGRFGEDFDKMDEDERAAFIKNHGYFVIEEMVELFRETKNHKSWKDYSDWDEEKCKKQLQKAREEYIDVFHFVINVGLALGMDSNKILEMYKDKNKINIERQENPELGYVK